MEDKETNHLPHEGAEEIREQSQVNEHDAAEGDSFAELFEASLNEQPVVEPDRMVSGTVVGRDVDSLLVDVGAKVEGAVPLSEFSEPGKFEMPEIGEKVQVVIKSSGRGGLKLSMREALQKAVWKSVEEALKTKSTIKGEIVSEIKGGYQVDLGGVRAFLPKSEADVNPRHQVSALIGTPCEMAIISANYKQENIVVSRRQPQQALLDEKRRIFFDRVSIGDRVSGVVKRLTDFGAFVEVNGVDTLLHVSDISWRRLQHPDEALSVGQMVVAEIVKLDPDSGKVSLSMRVLQADPWKKVTSKYEVGMRLTGTVRRLLDYGAMVELEPGVEGMIHRSQMSWTRKEVRPTAVLAEGDVVDVAVLEILQEKRRIALSLKAVMENPWQAWLAKYPIGIKVTGKVRNITDFGLFVGLNDELDGLVHIGNLSWDRPGSELLDEYQKGQEVTCVVLGGDIERQRISLGIKQLTVDPFDIFLKGAGRGACVHGTVTGLKSGEAIVEISKGVQAVLSLREVPHEHDEIKIGTELDAKIIEVDRSRRKVKLSINLLIRDEERDAIRSYSRSMRKDPAPSALALELKRKLAALPKASQTNVVHSIAKPATSRKAKAAEPKRSRAK